MPPCRRVTLGSMRFHTLATVLVLLAASCSTPTTDGLRELSPLTWTALADCGDGELRMATGEVTALAGDWFCIPLKPEKYMGWIRCWRGDSEFTLAAPCEPGFYHSMAYIEGCRVEITCEGGAL